jgi:hypothetical protein
MAAFQAPNPSLDVCSGSVFLGHLMKVTGCAKRVVELGGWLGLGGRYSFHACWGIELRNCLWMSNGSYWQHWGALCFSSWDLGGPVCWDVWNPTMSTCISFVLPQQQWEEIKINTVYIGASQQLWKWTCIVAKLKNPLGLGWSSSVMSVIYDYDASCISFVPPQPQREEIKINTVYRHISTALEMNMLLPNSKFHWGWDETAWSCQCASLWMPLW